MLHGVLLVNKKEGGTSHDVVQSVRKIVNQKQVGHAGTLDPMAEGLMVILLGYGTKISQWLLKNDKSYHFVFRLGVQTDTLDKTGKIIMRKKVQVLTHSQMAKGSLSQGTKTVKDPNKGSAMTSGLAFEKDTVIKLKKATLQEVIEGACGEISMPVPAFSAVKIKGKKMYEYQRAGKPVEPPFRKMYFYDLKIKNIQEETVEVILSCKKGSYVRAWVSYIGEKLGTGACLESLTRLSSQPFELSSALSLKELRQRLSAISKPNMFDVLPLLKPAFVPFSQTLEHLPKVELNTGDEHDLKHGKISIEIKKMLQERQKVVNKNRAEQIVRAMDRSGKVMLALLRLSPFKSPRIEKVFPIWQRQKS